MSKQKQYAGLAGVFSLLVLSFLILSMPIHTRSKELNESDETKAKRKGTVQVLDFVHSKAIKTADTVDVKNYIDIDTNIAKHDSAYYAHAIAQIINNPENDFLSQQPTPWIIGGMQMDNRSKIVLDSEKLNKSEELKEASRGYHDAIVVLEINRRTNHK